MDLKERVYSVLVVSASENFNSALTQLLPVRRYEPVRYVGGIGAAGRALNEREFDFVIINAPLPDGMGTELAVELGLRDTTLPLLILRSDILEGVHGKLTENGVFSLPKPITSQAFALAMDWLATARERQRKSEKKTLTMEEKMEEIRLVNRAKWLLITELKMEEPQAHRYIEKQAMDRCLPRRKIAEEIIRTYS